jgi:putative hemolysin
VRLRIKVRYHTLTVNTYKMLAYIMVIRRSCLFPALLFGLKFVR